MTETEARTNFVNMLIEEKKASEHKLCAINLVIELYKRQTLTHATQNNNNTKNLTQTP